MREECLLTVHTFIVSLLKAWKVTVVWIECDDFKPFQEDTP